MQIFGPFYYSYVPNSSLPKNQDPRIFIKKRKKMIACQIVKKNRKRNEKEKYHAVQKFSRDTGFTKKLNFDHTGF